MNYRHLLSMLCVVSLGLGLQACGGEGGKSTTIAESTAPTQTKDIFEGESEVRFTVSSDVKSRRARMMQDRYQETIILKNNAPMVYNRALPGGPDFGPADVKIAAQTLGEQAEIKMVKDAGVVFDASKVKTVGKLAYFVGEHQGNTCFLYSALIGDQTRANKHIRGNICYPDRARSVEALEREMLPLLSHARFQDMEKRDVYTVTLGVP